MIKIQDNNKIKMKIIADMPISLANAIRRSVLEIPVMAIDEVEISKNDSALFDEILAHRLGLIPIKTKKISSKEIKFKLSEKGPKMVYSTDLKPNEDIIYKMPIVLLEEGQEIQLVATAKFGKGIEHVKYSPGMIYYNYNIDEDILDFVHIDEEGKVNYDEKEIKERCSDEQLEKTLNHGGRSMLRKYLQMLLMF